MSMTQVLGLCGSLRRQSRNLGLLRYAMSAAPDTLRIEQAEIGSLPFYNQDLTEKPAAVQTFFAQLERADALLIACPEYNYSLAPALKNALDWASRESDNRLLKGKTLAMMGAAAGMGSSRAQYHLRQVAVYLDLHPLNRPEIFSNAFSPSFDAEGTLIDEKIQALVRQQLDALHEWTQCLKSGRG